MCYHGLRQPLRCNLVLQHNEGDGHSAHPGLRGDADVRRHGPQHRHPAGEKPYYNLVLLARDFEGYQNLVHLASKAFTEGFQFKPRIDLDLLASRNSGLIALSGGVAGPIGHFLSRGDQAGAVITPAD